MSVIKRIAFFAILLVLWAVVVNRHVWDPTLLPHPLTVGQTLWHLFTSGMLLDSLSFSLRRVLEGYFVSLLIGVPLGILLARNKLARETVGSIVVGFQALPSICWLPLALLWFGLNESAILFVVIMGSLVSIAVAVQDGVQNLPPTYIRAARTMGTRGWRMYTDVLLPASLPAMLIGAKLGWSYAWRALMAGELLYVSRGLGHALNMGRELGDMSQVLSVMVIIIAIGLITDTYIFGAVERQVRARWGLNTA